MNLLDSDGPLMGLLLENSLGQVVWCGVSNGKGQRKSLEHNRLWVLDGRTGRLLPLEDLDPGLAAHGQLEWIRLEQGFIRARSKSAEGPTDTTLRISPSSSGSLEPGPRPALERDHGDQNPDLSHLARLEAVIRQRRQEMPEGSYTTHLFKSGLSKIRKKTGEEAVEMILADSPAETVAEAADLIYHLMVLLVAQDIPLARVMEELGRR